MADTPAFIGNGIIGSGSSSTANTAVDGTGTINTLVTGTTLSATVKGTRVLEIVAQIAITGASTASLVNLFLSVDSGITWRLEDQITLAAATGSASVKSTRNFVLKDNLVLVGPTHRLGWAPTVGGAQVTNAFAFGGDI